MYYKTSQTADQLEKELSTFMYKKFQGGMYGLTAFAVGDEYIINDNSGFLTQEDRIIFFVNLIEFAARNENWTSPKFLDEIPKIISPHNEKSKRRE